MYDGRSDVDYVLTGRLEKLEEIDYDGGIKVQVQVAAQMTDLASGATVWTNEISEVGAIGNRDVPAVVAAINQKMDRAIEKLLTPAPKVPASTNVK